MDTLEVNITVKVNWRREYGGEIPKRHAKILADESQRAILLHNHFGQTTGVMRKTIADSSSSPCVLYKGDWQAEISTEKKQEEDLPCSVEKA